MADINDVYVWMDGGGSKINLAMTVSPGDPGTRTFGPGVQYVFHITSKPGLGVLMPGTETKVICTFTSNTAAKCWVSGATSVKDYIEGDPSATAGITSVDGKVRLFAGRRSDPFFFNLQGFRDAVTTVKSVAGTLTFNAAGCPNNLPDASAAVVRGKLQEGAQAAATPPCATDNADCFIHLKVMAIVLQLDKSLVLESGQTVVGVWGSTHMGS